MHSPCFRVNPKYSILSFMMIFTFPALSTLSVLLGAIFIGLKSKIKRRLAGPLIALILTSMFASASAILNSTYPKEIFESTKFLFMAIAFWIGFSSRLQRSEIQILGLFISISIILWYFISFNLGVQVPFFYPPDFNNSAVFLVFLAFLISEGRGLIFRFFVVAMLIFFSEVAQSRILLLFVPVFFISQPISLSPLRLVALSVVVFSGVAWMYSQNEFGSFSDLARIEIYSIAWETVSSRGFVLLANGPQEFVDTINDSLPPFFAERLDLQHSHNAFLDIAGGYGLLAACSFLIFIILMLRVSILAKNDSLRNQLLVLVLLLTVEAIISDSRVMFGVLLFLGMQAALSRQWPTQ